jgi:hypothetical protein
MTALIASAPTVILSVDMSESSLVVLPIRFGSYRQYR